MSQKSLLVTTINLKLHSIFSCSLKGKNGVNKPKGSRNYCEMIDKEKGHRNQEQNQSGFNYSIPKFIHSLFAPFDLVRLRLLQVAQGKYPPLLKYIIFSLPTANKKMRPFYYLSASFIARPSDRVGGPA